MTDKGRGGYPSDVTDEEWAFVLPYLLLCREDSPQRKHELRTVFNAVRYVARTGGQWRFLPHDSPPWYVVYQQMQRWPRAGCFELLVEDVRSLLREWGGARTSRRRSRSTAERCNRRRNRVRGQAMTTRATPGQTPPRPLNNTACGWRWSSIPWRNGASCCCRAGGWWSAASPGPHASADSPETTNGSTPPSKDSICSH